MLFLQVVKDVDSGHAVESTFRNNSLTFLAWDVHSFNKLTTAFQGYFLKQISSSTPTKPILIWFISNCHMYLMITSWQSQSIAIQHQVWHGLTTELLTLTLKLAWLLHHLTRPFLTKKCLKTTSWRPCLLFVTTTVY